ncbi:MAG: site-specific integrase [Anaerolineales bacterium]
MGGGGLVLGKPKTESSIRSIRIGIESIEVLKMQMEKIQKERVNKCKLWQDKDFVFPSTIGTAKDPSGLVKKFKLSLKEAGLSGIRFHDLRHTSASLMLNNGVDIFVASKRLGHAKPSITLDVYGHLLSTAQNDVAEKMEILIK